MIFSFIHITAINFQTSKGHLLCSYGYDFNPSYSKRPTLAWLELESILASINTIRKSNSKQWTINRVNRSHLEMALLKKTIEVRWKYSFLTQYRIHFNGHISVRSTSKVYSMFAIYKNTQPNNKSTNQPHTDIRIHFP